MLRVWGKPPKQHLRCFPPEVSSVSHCPCIPGGLRARKRTTWPGSEEMNMAVVEGAGGAKAAAQGRFSNHSSSSCSTSCPPVPGLCLQRPSPGQLKSQEPCSVPAAHKAGEQRLQSPRTELWGAHFSQTPECLFQ